MFDACFLDHCSTQVGGTHLGVSVQHFLVKSQATPKGQGPSSVPNLAWGWGAVACVITGQAIW